IFTGGGKYEPDDMRFHSLSRLPLRSTSNAAIDSSSTPAAPLLAFTRRYASKTTRLEISNGLDFGSLTWLLPAPPVDHQANQGDPSPSLHPHSQASSLLRDGLPPCPATVLDPSRCAPLGELPLALSRRWGQYRGDRFSRSVQEPEPGSRRLHAGRHL